MPSCLASDVEATSDTSLQFSSNTAGPEASVAISDMMVATT